jgi:hypothetical protein
VYGGLGLLLIKIPNSQAKFFGNKDCQSNCGDKVLRRQSLPIKTAAK